MRKSRARPICKRAGCGRKIPKLAHKFKDPYCSRVCLRIDLNMPEPPKIFLGRTSDV